LRNGLSHDVSVVAAISPIWAVADAGVSAASVLIPLGGGVYSAWKAKKTLKSMLVARKLWLLAVTGGKIAQHAVAQVDKSGAHIRSGETVQIYKMSRLWRWTRPSGLASRLGARPVKVIVSDAKAGRVATVASHPGTSWTITEDGVTADGGKTYPWVAESAAPQTSVQQEPRTAHPLSRQPAFRVT